MNDKFLLKPIPPNANIISIRIYILTMSVTIEVQDEPKLVDGYPKLAQRMDATPETAILRRFGALNIQSLLYFQAELIHLEMNLRELELAASKSEDDILKKYARDWAWLGLLRRDEKDEHWQTVLAIRKTLKEYSGYF